MSHKFIYWSMMNVIRGKYLIKIVLVVIALTLLLLAFLQRNNSLKLKDNGGYFKWFMENREVNDGSMKEYEKVTWKNENKFNRIQSNQIKDTEKGKINHLKLEALRKDSYYNIAENLVLINKNEIIFTEKYRQRMKEKGNHPLHSYLPFKERNKNIESFCSYWENQFNRSNSLDISGRRLLFVDKFELLACNIPKASSTTITEIFMRMDQGLSSDERPRGPTGVKANISISNNRMEDNENINTKRVQTYTKILLTRHPFSLIGSKYHFKVTNTAENKFQREICPEIIKKLYLKGLPTDEDSFIQNREDKYAHLTDGEFNEKLIQIRRLRAGPGNYNITLLEYVRTIVNKQNEEVSPSGQTLMCNPCAVRYDVILHYSNVNEEANLVLDYIQRNLPYDKRVHYMANSPLVSQTKCNEEFSRIPMETRRKLYEFFKFDFLLFGYHFEDNPKNLNACF